jgi:adenosine deaminase CECR1
VDEMSEHGVRVEVCPISDKILGLMPRISGHAVYSLPANNVSCTISTDNGTLFGLVSSYVELSLEASV